MKRCSICDELGGGLPDFGESYQSLVESGSNIIAQTANLVVLPSIGALHPSHVMIVPLQHVLSFASVNLSVLNEASALVEEIAYFGKQKYGWNLGQFEHGSGSNRCARVACIDHAHIHLVHAEPGLAELVLRGNHWEKFDSLIDCMRSADTDNGYLYFQFMDSGSLLCNSPAVSPQFFRQVYAFHQNDKSAWNWRLNFRMESVQAAISAYRGFKPSGN